MDFSQKHRLFQQISEMSDLCNERQRRRLAEQLGMSEEMTRLDAKHLPIADRLAVLRGIAYQIEKHQMHSGWMSIHNQLFMPGDLQVLTHGDKQQDEQARILEMVAQKIRSLQYCSTAEWNAAKRRVGLDWEKLERLVGQELHHAEQASMYMMLTMWCEKENATVWHLLVALCRLAFPEIAEGIFFEARRRLVRKHF